MLDITGCAGLDDLLVCFCAGATLNWNGKYLDEMRERHDEVNGSIEIVIDTGGSMYIGAILPWDELNKPDLAAITYGRLLALGLLVLLLHGSVVRHNRFSRAVSRDGLNFSDLESKYAASERVSRSRPSPETPTWRLTKATDETLKAETVETQRRKGPISFVDNDSRREG